MLLRPPMRPILTAGFVWPCLPTSAAKPPSGSRWLHEVKHDGFRVIARKIDKRVKLYSRSGNDLTYRFPLIVEAMDKLRVQSCAVDGEAVACSEDGLSSFDRICYRQHDASVFMWAFDLIELDGDDLRFDPLETRKSMLATLLLRAPPGLRLNEHIEEEDGSLVFQHACKLGLEASCLSTRTRATIPAGHGTGSKARIRSRQLLGGKLKSIGSSDGPGGQGHLRAEESPPFAAKEGVGGEATTAIVRSLGALASRSTSRCSR